MAAATTRAYNARRAVRDGARSEAVARRTQPPPPRPRLVAVPRRRRTARLATAGLSVVFLLMLGVVAFQTQLAENQLELDRIEQRIELARSRARELRRDSAALRSPDRIAVEAAALGMGPTTSRNFLVVPAAVEALVAVSAGDALDGIMTRESNAFRDYQETKQLVAGEATP